MKKQFSSLKIIYLIGTLQLAMTGFVLLDNLGINVPILRQALGFIYLTIIPGFLLIQLFGIRKSSISEILLFSIGLSLSILMLTGFLLNLILPFFKLTPISTNSLFFTFSIIIVFFCYLFYKKTDCIEVEYTKFNYPLQLSFLYLLPLMAIIGTYIVNYMNNNIILMLLFVLICIVSLLISLGIISENLYCMAIYLISLSLLYHYSLISNYICGFDIHHEYYIANMVIENSYWDSSLSFNVNSMLSIAMLAPIYSYVCNLELTWVFKIIYPLIYSFVPLCLYVVFSKQMSKKIAFFSCFFFMSVFVYYTEMLSLARQQIAELYLVLLVLLITSQNLSKIQRSSLFIIFSFSLAVSHYGLSYIFMLQFIAVGAILFVKNNLFSSSDRNYSMVSPVMISLFFTFTISWYLFISSNTPFSSIIHIINNIIQNLASEFLNPEFAQGTHVLLKTTVSPLHSVLKYLHILCQILIALGLIAVISKKVNFNIEKEYIYFSLTSFLLALAGVAVPFFGSSLNTTRLYHITLIFLAPFFSIGFFVALNILSAIINRNRLLSIKQVGKRRYHYTFISVFLIVFLLFNSGWVYEVANDNPRSISLSKKSMLNSNSDTEIVYYYTNGGYTPEQTVFGSKWLRNHASSTLKVYSDSLHKSHTLQSYGMLLAYDELLSNSRMKKGSYLFLGYLNDYYGLMWSSYPKNHYSNVTDFKMLESNISQIYSNGKSKVYLYN